MTVFIHLPDAVLHAIQVLNAAGFEAYAVGGCVRDSLFGKTPEDWDITTSATPAELQIVFGAYHTVETGLRHGTLTVLVDDMPLEITTYRVDGDYSDGRHPDAVVFTRSLAEDLKRRDFTVNAMAYHPESGLVDLYGGQADLAAGVIRCVGTPAVRFGEDALRILRALRFASVLGFSIDSDTAESLVELSPNLCCVSVERIAAEFKKLLCGKDAVDILSAYRSVISAFLPEVNGCDDFTSLSRMRLIPYARFAALFFGSDVSAESAESVLRRLRLDTKTIRNVALLLTYPPRSIHTEKVYLLRLLNRLGVDLVYDYLALHEADDATVACVDQLLKEGACYQISMLDIAGDDIIRLGVNAGPDVGRILQELLDAVMDGVCVNRNADLLDYVTKNKKPVQ